MQSFVERGEAAHPEQLTLRSLNAALSEERLRLDHRMDAIRNEITALGHELAQAEQRRGAVDALLADDAGTDFAQSA